jgi:hypothetical protein
VAVARLPEFRARKIDGSYRLRKALAQVRERMGE